MATHHMQPGDVVWEPPAGARRESPMGRFLTHVEDAHGLRFDGYGDLHRWSVDNLEAFWREIWRFFRVGDGERPERVLVGDTMPDVRWFPDSRVNLAEHALRTTGDGPAVIARSQSRPRIELSHDELRREVARARAGLRRLGVGRGDRVAAYLPNCPEAQVAHFAAASLGAIWSSCAPEFGARSVLDRLSQIEPKVLLAINGYRYGDKLVDRNTELAAIRAGLPSLEATVVVPYVDGHEAPPDTVAWAELVSEDGPLEFEPLPFDHPAAILYSSGTTGLPKPIVHGHGGLLLEHLKSLGLQFDIRAGDRFFWFTTTGWVMWNMLTSGHLLGATTVLFDGDLAHPDLMALWRMAAEERVTFFGVGAGYLLACRRAGLRPRDLDLSALRIVGSAGSPLPSEGYEWFYDAVASDVPLVSASGGTDVASGFVGGSPLVPVYAGELSCQQLGCDVAAFDASGRSVVDEMGELVVRKPMPSMPVRFWGDDDGERLRSSYFDLFPGVWRHGDWITFTSRGTCVISGRSDATLNRGGVRLGTAELYTVAEDVAGVEDSLVVYLPGDAERTDRLILFVVLANGAELDDGLRAAIKTGLRSELSPRHVPDDIVAVPAIPRTLTGKKLEVPVKRILLGAPADTVVSRDALANPEAIDAFVDLQVTT